MKKSMVVLASTGLLLGVLYLFSPYRAEEERDTLRFLYPEISPIQDTVSLQGTVVAAKKQLVYARGSSRILEIYVSEGQRVTAGQCLMKLEQSEIIYDEQAAAAAVLTRLQTAVSSGDLSGAQALIDSINVNNSIQNNDCEVYYLYSENDAVVMSISAVAGETVGSLLPCMELFSPNDLQVEATAGEEVVGLLSNNMECYVSVSAFDLKDMQGRLIAIAPYASQTTRLTGQTTCETAVQIQMSDPSILRPGYRASAKVVVSFRENAILLPYEAIGQDDSGQEYVLKLQGLRIMKQPIETGSELEDRVEVCQGLKKQDAVMLHPDLQWEGALVHLVSR